MKKKKFILIELAGADGGMFPYMAGLSREIRGQGYDCTILTSRHSSCGVKWPNGVSVNYTFGKLKLRRRTVGKLTSLILGLLRMWSICLGQRPAYKNFHVFRLDAISIIVTVVLLITPGKVVLTVHDINCLKGKTRENDTVRRLALRLPDAIVVHNDFAQHALSEISSDNLNIIVMPHGIDPPRHVDTSGTFQSSRDLTFGIFGNLKRTKGILDAIDAFGELARTERNVRIRIVGRDIDNLATEIESRIVQAGIFEICDFENRFLSEDEFLLEMHNVDVVIVPYHMIYQSGIAATSASLGKAIVASNLPGLRDTLGNCALFFEPGNVEELTNALKKLKQFPELRHYLGGRAQRRVAELFSWRLAARKLIDGLADLKSG